MRTQLVLLVLGFFGLAYTTFDMATYKQQYQTQVGVPYKSAITVVATDIIEFLAVSPVPTTADAGRQILNGVKAKAQIFSDNLSTASKSSDSLKQQLDKEIETLVAQAGGVEQQINANEQQLQAINAKIQSTAQQLAQAQDQVNKAQASVQHAQDVVRQEDDKVNKARQCTFIGGWLGSQICGLFNHDGIDRANRDRDQAQRELNNQRQRLANLQAEQAQHTAEQNSFLQAKANFESIKANLNAQLAQLKQARDIVTNVDIALKSLITHMTALLGNSEVLVDVVKNLINMEAIITPLTATADQIISYTTNADDVAYLNTMKQKISASIPLVQQKLPQYALIPPK